MLAVMVDAALGLPQFAHDFEAFVENPLVVLERHPERQIFAPVIAAAGGEIDAAVAEQIERRPLLGDPDRIVQRQHRDGGSEPDMLGARGDIGEHQIGTGQHAERIEMMLADPGRMHAELVGIQRFVGDVGDELVGRARVVRVMVVAQCEIAEFHFILPRLFFDVQAIGTIQSTPSPSPTVYFPS